MRVCELAKKVKASNAEVIKQAEQLDIEVYSALSLLEDDDISRLQEAFGQRTAEEIAQSAEEQAKVRADKRAKALSMRVAQDKTMRAVLDANRERALEMDAVAKGLPPPGAVAAPEPAPAAPESAAAPAQKKPAAVAAVKQPEKKTAGAAAAAKPAAPAKAPAKAAETTAKPGVKTKPRYQDDDEDLEPEEQIAAAFIGKKAKSDARDMPKSTKALAGQKHDKVLPPQRGGARLQQQRAKGRQQHVADARQVPPDRVILLRGAVVVKDLAEKLGVRPNRLIADLMQLNILASINQRVEFDVAQKIADKYGFKVELERQKRSTERKPVLKSEDADDMIPDDPPEACLPRPPVVTFLGHVDHGKTSLMDCIRNTRVASGEAGGITQHIGAYTVDINGRKITFLDTPGHAAFSAMRARGANLTDIAVIVIAADDGMMPQTREAVKHAQQAGVQIMVAINKCDLPTAKPDRVRQMLQSEGLTPEEWGGDVICTEVSALTGAGIDNLLEMILLQADMLELAANPDRRADGYVVEAQLEQGLGPTATLLITGGVLKVGDIVLCGEYFGRVRGLIDDRGCRVKSAGPAMAVKCMGLSGVPEAGAHFRVMLNDRRARSLAEQAAEERKQIELSGSFKATSLDALMNQMKDNLKLELAVIVKADTQGSSEAVCEALRDIKSEKVSLNIISEAIGNVSATDVNKAAAGGALVLGFNVGCEAGVQQLARHHGVRIATFRIIYELLDFATQRMLDLLPPEYKEVVKGHALIKAIFDIGKTGRVAGCQMLDGVLLSSGRYRILRNREVIWDGKLKTLKHFQDEVSEVSGSQECGIAFSEFEDFAEGDTVECYVLEELPRSL
jgi:translation initiation factor IF-2